MNAKDEDDSKDGLHAGVLLLAWQRTAQLADKVLEIFLLPLVQLDILEQEGCAEPSIK